MALEFITTPLGRDADVQSRRRAVADIALTLGGARPLGRPSLVTHDTCPTTKHVCSDNDFIGMAANRLD